MLLKKGCQLHASELGILAALNRPSALEIKVDVRWKVSIGFVVEEHIICY